MNPDNIINKREDTEARRSERTRAGRMFRPNVDIVETADELTVLADLPGATTESIDINFENGLLTLHARIPERRADSAGFLLREYGVGDFYRTFEVSEAVDANRISAEYRNGVLTLHLPKAEAVKPRKIAVSAS